MTSMAEDVDIWVLKAPQQRLSQAVEQVLTMESSQRGWQLHQREAIPTRDGNGRPLNLLRPGDAASVYSRAHNATVGVLVDDRLRVMLDPSRTPTTGRARKLSSYLRYKALVSRLGYFDAVSAAEFILALAAWAQATNCEGDSDPRVMPLHVFDDDAEYDRLDEMSGRQDFVSRFGGSSRRDPSGRVWERADDRHAMLQLSVAGRALTAGAHWDVQNPARTAKRVATPDRVVSIHPGGYVNVYPNAFLRIAGGQASEIWSEGRHARAAVRPATTSRATGKQQGKGPARGGRGRFRY